MGWKKITTVGDMKVDSDPTNATDFAGADVLFNHTNGKLWFLKSDSTAMWSLTLDTDLDHITTTNLNLELNTFSDDLGASQNVLIGDGNWKEIEDITFSVGYTNGPPTSVTIYEIGATPDLKILDAGTSAQDVSANPKNLVAVPYPARIGSSHLYDSVQFKIHVEGPGSPGDITETTEHNQFVNQIRYGSTEATSIDATAITDDLENVKLIELTSSHEGLFGFTPTASEYIAIAHPSTGLSDLNASFRYDGFTAGFESSGTVSWTNGSNYEEVYTTYRSTIPNMGAGVLTTNVDYQSTVNHHFLGITTEAVTANIDPEDGADLGSDSGLGTSKTWGSVNVTSGKYLFLAFAGRLTALGNLNFKLKDDNGDYITADVDSEIGTLQYQNEQGSTEAFDIYRLTEANTGNRDFSTADNTIYNHFFQGKTTSSVSSITLNGDGNTVSTNNGTDGSFDEDTNTWGDIDAGTGSHRVFVAYSARHIALTEGATSVEFRINDTSAGFSYGTGNYTNLFGYVESYRKYRCLAAGTGDKSLTTGNTAVKNETRWGKLASVSSANVNALIASDLSDDLERNDWDPADNVGSGEYLCLAYSNAYVTIANNVISDTEQFRIGSGTGSALTAKFTLTNNLTHTNQYGFEDNYHVWVCDAENTGTQDFYTYTSTNIYDLAYVGNLDVALESMVATDIDDLDGETERVNSGDGTVENNFWDTGSSTSGEYATIAYPANITASGKPNSENDFKMRPVGGSDYITAKFVQRSADLTHTNVYKYSHPYEVWQCVVDDTGNNTLDIDSNHSSIVSNWTYIGVSSSNEIGANIVADLEAVNAYAGDTFQNTDKNNLAVSDSQYIWFSYPDRYPDPVATDFRLEGLTAGFTKEGSVYSTINEYGYQENYQLWISDENGTNLIAAPDFNVDNGFSPDPKNHQMHGGLDVATYNQAFLDSLVDVSAIISNDNSQTATNGRACVATASNYTYMAFPARLNIDAAKFRYEKTGGDELQAAFTQVLSDFEYRNQAGFKEDYDLFKSDVQDLPDGKIGWGQSSLELNRYMGLVNTSAAADGVLTEGEVEAITGQNSIGNSASSHVKTWSAVNTSTDQHIVIAVPTHYNELEATIDYDDDSDGNEFTIDSGGLVQTAGFVKQSDLPITNEYGYDKDYDIYISKHPGIGKTTSSVTLTTHSSKQLKAHMYIGYSTATSATGNVFGADSFPNSSSWSEIETTVPISGTTSADKYDTYTLTVDNATDYFWYIYPKRLGEVEFFYISTNLGAAGGMQTVQTIELCNEAGWTEEYYCYRSDNQGTWGGGGEATSFTLQAASS